MHIPVLQKEVLKYLDPRRNENFIDCTIGEGGHSFVIAKRILPEGKILGIDWDAEVIRRLKIKNPTFAKATVGKQKSPHQPAPLRLARPGNKFGAGQAKTKNIIPVCENFANLQKIVQKHHFHPVSGILFDLGMSSWHLGESGRGLSFLRNEPLDMRYNIKSKIKNQKSKIQVKIQNLTAEKIVNEYSQENLEHILREYGEERFAGQAAKKIVDQRKIAPITTTFQLVDIIKKATPRWYHRQRIHPATRTFQALRVAVNDELGNLTRALPDAFEVLGAGGRLAVISFHSLEDRIVKNFFREKAKRKEAILMTRKPITASGREAAQNPRARSAKLRVLEKLTTNN